MRDTSLFLCKKIMENYEWWPPEPECFDVKELCEYLGVSRTTYYYRLAPLLDEINEKRIEAKIRPIPKPKTYDYRRNLRNTRLKDSAPYKPNTQYRPLSWADVQKPTEEPEKEKENESE